MKGLKKVICVILCMWLCCGSVPFCAFAQDGALTFTVVSDTHMQSIESLGDISLREDYNEDDIYWNTTMQGQMSDWSEAIFASFLNSFYQGDSDILLIPGDLTDGYWINHEHFAEMMAQKQREDPQKRIYVINGNHDIDDENPEKMTSAQDFKTVYASFGYEEALAVDTESCSYAADLDENVRLLAIDSCVYGQDNGKISESRKEWILSQLTKAKAENKIVVAMMHHSVVPHFSLQSMMKDHEAVAELLADNGVKYVFSGHMHGSDIAGAVSKAGNKIYDIMTGSLITAPCAVRSVTLSQKEMTISTQGLEKLDIRYLPQGTTLSQKERLENDFSSYAQTFFTKGMWKWLMKYIGSANFVAKKLKLEKESLGYKAVDFVLGCAGKALALPLYDDGSGSYRSMEQIAAAFGYTVPKTSYTYPSDVVGAVMGAFFHGDEDIKADDAEIKLLYTVVSAGLSYAVLQLAQLGMQTSLTQAFYDAVGLLTKKTDSLPLVSRIAGTKLADMILGTVLAPLVQGVSSDEYAPSDLNTVLEGPSENSEKTDAFAPLSVWKKILSYFKSFFIILFKLK